MYSPDHPELLRLFVENTPAAVAMCDNQLRFLLISRQWLTQHGLEKQNIMGCSHYDVFPKLPKKWQRSAERCLAKGIKQCAEASVLKPDGSARWVTWEMHPWRDSAGEIGGLLLFTEETVHEGSSREGQPTESEESDNAQTSASADNLSSKPTSPPKRLGKVVSKSVRQSNTTKVGVLGQTVEWHPKQGCLLKKLPVVMMWIDTGMASLMSAVQAMVGQKRFALALQSEGRNSIEADWEVISQYEDFSEGIKAFNELAIVAGWGELELLNLDLENKECRFRAKNSWEGRYQKALGVCWGSGMLAGKLSGYCSRLFKTNCWAEQVAFISRGDEYDEFIVRPSMRSIEEEIEKLLGTDEATRADMAVALQKLQHEVAVSEAARRERQKAEEALAKSEARNRAFLEAIPDIMFRVGKDGIVRDLRFPPEIEQSTPRTQLLGKSLYEVLPPEVAEQAMHHTEQCLSTGEIQVFEYQLKVNDSWRFYESRLVVSGEAEVLAILRDITERKSAEDARRKSEELYRTLARNLPNGTVVLFDHQLRYTLAEGTDLQAVGLSKESLEGKSVRDVFPPESYEQMEPAYRAALAGEATVIEVPFADRLYLVHTLPVKNEHGDIIAGMSLAQNITQAKQTEEALRQSAVQLQEKNQQLEQALHDLQKAQAQLIQSEKMSSLGQLVAGVAHEINNPVNFIYGNLAHARDYTQDLLNLLQLYQQHYPNPEPEIEEERDAIELDFLVEDLPKLVSSMEIGAERICEIVRSLRNFSRIDEAEMKEVDLHEGLDSTLLILQNRLKPKSEHSGIQIIKEYGNLPLVECYPGQLNQVFMNILTNAIDALEEQMETHQEDSQSSMPTIWICTTILDGSQRRGNRSEWVQNFQNSTLRGVATEPRLALPQEAACRANVSEYEAVTLAKISTGEVSALTLAQHSDGEQQASLEERGAVFALTKHSVSVGATTEEPQAPASPHGITAMEALPECSPWVTIRIADNGPGMTPEIAQRLFDPFFTTKPIGIGTGLGLSISYQIVVEKHGGHLRCETGLNRGTEFIIEIPITQSERID